MGKMKTHKGSKKRFKKTARGKYKRTQAFKSHLMTRKSGSKKRDLRGSKVVHESDKGRLDQALPYE